ncbi:MAG: hypothetical protein ACRDQF_18600, partial [Thermocrispum sp.]
IGARAAYASSGGLQVLAYTGAAQPAGDGLEPPLGQWRDASWITARPGTTGHAMVVRACEAAGFTPFVAAVRAVVG